MTDARNGHDKTHAVMKVVVPEKGPLIIAITVEGGLRELVDCLSATGGVSVPGFTQYYASIDAEKE
jgi:hypothetical protein